MGSLGRFFANNMVPSMLMSSGNAFSNFGPFQFGNAHTPLSNPSLEVPSQHNPGHMLGIYQCLEVDLFHIHILSLGAMPELAQVLYLSPVIRLETLLLCQEDICLEATHTIVLINKHSLNLSFLGTKSKEIMYMGGGSNPYNFQ